MYHKEKPQIGTPRKIRLISNALGYGPMPAPDEEVEQHLTVNAKGQVWFSSYNFGNCNGHYQKTKFIRFSIEEKKAELLLHTVVQYFEENPQELFVTDVGTWSLEITDCNGRVFRFKGSLCSQLNADNIDLTDLIRNILQMNNLFAFGGKYV